MLVVSVRYLSGYEWYNCKIALEIGENISGTDHSKRCVDAESCVVSFPLLLNV